MMIAEVVDGTRLVSTLNGDSDVGCFLCNQTVSMRGHSLTTVVAKGCPHVEEWLTSNFKITAPVQSAGHIKLARRAQGVET